MQLSSIRESLDSLINRSTIIIGHALDNDLKTLRIVHHRCVDTALLPAFRHPQGPPYRRALRQLSVRFSRNRLEYVADAFIQGERAFGDDDSDRWRYGRAFVCRGFQSDVGSRSLVHREAAGKTRTLRQRLIRFSSHIYSVYTLRALYASLQKPMQTFTSKVS